MNPLLTLVTLVGGLAAGRRLGPAGPDALPERAVADVAVATGLVGLVALLGLVGVVVLCGVLGLTVVLFG